MSAPLRLADDARPDAGHGVQPVAAVPPDALAPDGAEALAPLAEDGSLATAWPTTATARLVVLALLACGYGAAFLPTLVADPVTAWFLPLLVAGAALGKLVLDLPLRTANPSMAARATGVVLAAGAVSLTAAAVAAVAGTAGPGLAVGLVAACSLAAFACATVLRRWELRVLAAARRVLFVGRADQRADLAREIGRQQGMELVGFVPAADDAAAAGIEAAVAACTPTVVVFSSDAAALPAHCDVAVRLSVSGLRVATLTDLYRDHFGRVPLRDLQPSWVIREIADLHRPRTYALVKRVAERTFALSVLLVASPALLLAAAAVRLSSPGPVLFRQDRVGHRGATITVLKIRTMTMGAAGAWAGDDLHRVTRVGRLLRRFRIDEVPQLWNVVRGDLSLVGPRPEQVAIVARLADELPLYGARHWVRPGLTGWAQIRFGYGGSSDGARQKLEYDLYYVERQSLRLDLQIFIGTTRAVLRGIGT